jgi:hypothetical protein
LAERAWHGKRRILAILLWLALLPALTTILAAAIERTGGARDQANGERQAHAQRLELARTAVQDAKATADADEAAARAECSRAQKGADPRGPACKSLEARAEASRQRLATARNEQANVGVVPVDPQARRIAAVLPLSEEQVTLYMPLVLPMAISITGLLLVAAGVHRPPAPVKAPAKRKGKRRRKATKAKPAAASRKGQVLPFTRKA